MFEFIIPILEQYGLFAVLLSILLEGMMIPIPSFIVVPFGGFLASRGYFSWLTVAFWGSILNFIGSLIIFLWGSKIKFIHKISFIEKQITMSKNFFKKFGDKAVFFGRLIPALRMFIPLPAAIAKFPLRKFIFLNSIATIIWNFVFAFSGYTLGENWHLINAYGKYLTILVIIALPTSYLVYRKFEKILLEL